MIIIDIISIILSPKKFSNILKDRNEVDHFFLFQTNLFINIHVWIIIMDKKAQDKKHTSKKKLVTQKITAQTFPIENSCFLRCFWQQDEPQDQFLFINYLSKINVSSVAHTPLVWATEETLIFDVSFKRLSLRTLLVVTSICGHYTLHMVLSLSEGSTRLSLRRISTISLCHKDMLLVLPCYCQQRSVHYKCHNNQVIKMTKGTVCKGSEWHSNLSSHSNWERKLSQRWFTFSYYFC
jgi:hypothetical protein